MTPCPHCGKPAGQNDLRPVGEMICHHCGHDWLTDECAERNARGRDAFFAAIEPKRGRPRKEGDERTKLRTFRLTDLEHAKVKEFVEKMRKEKL